MDFKIFKQDKKQEEQMNVRKMLVLGFVCAMVIFGLGSSAFAAGKMAYVDLSSTFDKYEKTKTFDQSLSATQQAKEKELEQMAGEIKALEDKMSLLSEKEKAAKQTEMEAKQKKLQQRTQEIAMDLRKERDDKLKEILQDIEKVVQAYAQKNGYDFIFNDRVLLYGTASADVSQEIIDILNSEYKQPTAPAKPAAAASTKK
jgi:outer membrane protein